MYIPPKALDSYLKFPCSTFLSSLVLLRSSQCFGWALSQSDRRKLHIQIWLWPGLLAFPVFISPIVWNICENLHYESVYSKELNNEQEYYWPFTASFLPPVFTSIFPISWAMLAVRISFCNLGFIGYHVFDIRSGHIHFQGQYSLYFFPFVCSIFLVVFFALVVFVFNAFLVIIFLHPLPAVLQGSLIPCRITGT